MPVIEPRRLPHRLQNLQHTEPSAPTQVISLVPRLGRAIIEDFRVVGESIEREKVP